MNRLLAQKIDLGVTLEIDEIVGERQQPTPGKKQSMVVVRGRETTAHLLVIFPSAGIFRSSPTHVTALT